MSLISYPYLRKINALLKKMNYNFHGFLVELNKDLYSIDKFFDDNHYISNDYQDIHFHVIAIEDRRFLYHYGIDLKSLIRECLKLITFKKHGGASTIEMQLIRTLTKNKERTIKRKFKELILSISLNRKYTKLQILNCYLNNAYFGAYMNGINDAMFYSFKKEYVSQLTVFECSMIAAMLQQPRPKKSSLLREQLLIQRAVYAQYRASIIKEAFYKSYVSSFM
ncbi:transglycosylase domain-containing protein [Providencia rettgeri]|nr:transglycosylase domain-containing protein [Providencia rettgeri]